MGTSRVLKIARGKRPPSSFDDRATSRSEVVTTYSFQRLFEILAAIDLFGDAPPPVPYTLPPTVKGVGAVIDRGCGLLPRLFQESYGSPLKATLPSLISSLDARRLSLNTLETITGAVYEHGDLSIAAPLSRFLAVVSDLYRSFLSKKRRIAAGFPLTETLPPLAMFQHSGSSGPFTLPCDTMRSAIGAKVGVVSIPAVYTSHPLLWGALCHETGGHDVTHADEALLPELKRLVVTFLGGNGGSASDSPLMGALWSYWMDEATADVYGLLNMGPAFALNLIALFTALNARASGGKKPQLRSASGFDPDDPEKFLDEHPTDILRPFLAIGVIESLRGLPLSVKEAYINQLTQLTAQCAGQTEEVTLAGVIADGSGARIPISQNFPLAQMKLMARQVGAFISSVQLEALGNHCIQDIETWENSDEQTAQRIAAALLHQVEIKGLGDDAQLLAGATLAAFQQPELYDSINRSLNDALDVSFQDDPIWGRLPADRAFLKDGAFALPLDFVTAARICTACIHDVSGFSGPIAGQDQLSKFGFLSQDSLDNLVNQVVNDPTDGVPSAGFRIQDPNALAFSKGTTVSQMETAVVKQSVSAL